MVTALFLHSNGTVTAPMNKDGTLRIWPNYTEYRSYIISIGEERSAKVKFINLHPDDL